MSQETLINYKEEVAQELHQLLDWWMKYTVDENHGGFFGKVDNQNLPDHDAPKGLVLNARILYTFSSAYALTEKKEYLLIAVSAFNYILDHFVDPVNGGFYWSVNRNGEKLEGKKQVYGQAFAIYGLAAYYKITKNNKSLELAKQTFELLEKYSFDSIYTGYIEALAEDWSQLDDLRLSAKDQNEKKSMNTHLHVIEAYGALYQVWPTSNLKEAIKKLLINFRDYIINHSTNHLHLFFSESWEVKSQEISFGHDIEAAWLLLESAEIIEDQIEIKIYRDIAQKVAFASQEGLAENGGLNYEYHPLTKQFNTEWHWWPQAEAMVGYFNAWQLNADEVMLNQSIKSWSFIKNHLKDKENGEWFWGRNANGSLIANEDKAGFWKCPYHNGRACMEILKRTKRYIG